MHNVKCGHKIKRLYNFNFNPPIIIMISIFDMTNNCILERFVIIIFKYYLFTTGNAISCLFEHFDII